LTNTCSGRDDANDTSNSEDAPLTDTYGQRIEAASREAVDEKASTIP